MEPEQNKPDKDTTPAASPSADMPDASVSSTDQPKASNTSFLKTRLSSLQDRSRTAAGRLGAYPKQFRRPTFRSTRMRVAGVVVGLIIAAAGFGFLGGWLENQQNNASDSSLTSASSNAQRQVVTSEGQLINKIAKNVGPSVVSVNVTGQQSTTDFFGFSTPTETQSAGTGIILSKEGLIITNRHVVPAGTTNVSVTLSDGTTLTNVSVLGRTSASDSLDVAFLKVNDTKGKKLVPATIGDSSNVQVGDAVVAIGNALGQFQNTVTSGIISGFGRSVQASEQGTGQNAENLTDLFQTDAAINEGNSGGPLVNMSGDVIGINTAIAGNAQNIGFAIPINDVKGLIEQVMATGKLQRPYLGIRYVPITADFAYQYNLPVSTGAYIAPGSAGQPSVISGSPADKAGLKEKDIITQLNGTTIDQAHSLTSLLDQHKVGDHVMLTVIRNGKTMHVSVTLAAAPTS
ncbi:MAG TPA: trypsin-like peptidase domain-containing protein [Candidatus Saccharimonadales bacterium]|nr:trypsin-like peptidase domain-containing protein [Candidatus Saccharimonadales bacterium]